MIRTEHSQGLTEFQHPAALTCREQLYSAFGIAPHNPNEGIKAVFPPGFHNEDVAVGTMAYAQLLRNAWGLDEPEAHYAPTAEQYENALVEFRIRAEDVLLTRDTTEASRSEPNNLDADMIEYFIGELVFRLRGQSKPVFGVNGNGEKVLYQGGITSDNTKVSATRADRERLRRLYEQRRREKENKEQRTALYKIGVMFEIFPGETLT